MALDYQHWQRGWISRLVVFFVLATCVRVWVGPVGVEATAHAQLPDPAQQRLDLIHEARRTNELLTDIKKLLEAHTKLLETHTFNVRMPGADNQAPPSALPPGGGL